MIATTQQIADAVAGILKAARSIDTRAAKKVTTTLAADRKLIHDGLATIGSTDVPMILMGGATSVTPAPPVTAPPPETAAPTIPVAMPPTLAVGEVTFNWLASCDKHDGTNAATGVANCTPTVFGSDTATLSQGSEILGEPTLYQIGGAVGTATRQGDGWDLTCTGTGAIGLETTADQIVFLAWPATNVQAGSTQVTAFTAPDSPAVAPAYIPDYHGAGWMWRETADAGSKFVAIYYARNGYVYVKWRAATNGAVISADAALPDGSFGLLIQRPNGGKFSHYRQTAGAAMQLVREVLGTELTLASTGLAGPFVFSLSTQTASASHRQVALRSATYLSKTVSTAVAVTAELRATDANGNVSAKSASVTATPLSEASGVNWNPGHYAMQRGSDYPTNTSARLAAWTALNASDPGGAVKGVRQWAYFSQYYPTSGDYSTAIALIQQEIDHLKALSVPRRLILNFRTTVYGALTSSGQITNYFPSWMVSGGHLFNQDSGSGAIAFHNSATATNIGNFYAAIMAAFDNEPYFEGLLVDYEQSMSTPPSGYAAGLASVFTAAKAAAPHTNVWFNASYIGSPGGDHNTLLASAAAAAVGYCNLDTMSDLIDATGYFDTFGYTAFLNGNYLNVIPLMASVETSELGYNSVGRSGGYTASELGDWMLSRGVAHGCWDMNEEVGNANQRWSTGILPWIQAHPNLNTTEPSSY